MKNINIIQAIKDENLFRPYLTSDGDLTTWHGWMAVLRCLYGLPVQDDGETRQFIKEVTGRAYDSMPRNGFDTALFLTGRRCGKSRITAVIAAYEAVFSGREKNLSSGERGLVAVCSPTKRQSMVVKDYLEAVFDKSPVLSSLVASKTQNSITLTTGVRIEVAAGSFATIRGFTLLCAVLDELAFFGLDDDSKIKSDGELIGAIRPATATTEGKIIGISSPFWEKGWCYKTYKANFGNPEGRVLVVNCASKVMNPRLKQSFIDDALAEDYPKARSEFYGEFRQDVGLFLPRGVIMQCVIDGRTELPPQARPLRVYSAFADVSGGRSDGSALAIAHRENGRIVIDKLVHVKAPHNPHLVIADFATVLKEYGLTRVTGDKYAAEFNVQAFKSNGIRYDQAEKPKSDLYMEMLPLLTSGTVELPDDELLIHQLCRLERRCVSGGRDRIDHPSGPSNHDDLANAVAGVCVCATKAKRIAGAISLDSY